MSHGAGYGEQPGRAWEARQDPCVGQQGQTCLLTVQIQSPWGAHWGVGGTLSRGPALCPGTPLWQLRPRWAPGQLAPPGQDWGPLRAVDLAQCVGSVLCEWAGGTVVACGWQLVPAWPRPSPRAWQGRVLWGVGFSPCPPLARARADQAASTPRRTRGPARVPPCHHCLCLGSAVSWKPAPALPYATGSSGTGRAVSDCAGKTFHLV